MRAPRRRPRHLGARASPTQHSPARSRPRRHAARVGAGDQRPTPPTASLSIRPNADAGVHDLVAPSPVTPWQPDSCTLTGGKLCSPAANTSRTEPADAAGQCCPGGIAGSAQRAATMACTWVAPWSVTWRGAADPLTTTRSAAWPSEQSDPPVGVLAPVTGRWDEPRAEVDAGGAVRSAVALPHAASPIRAVAAIRTGIPRRPCRPPSVHPWTVAQPDTVPARGHPGRRYVIRLVV